LPWVTIEAVALPPVAASPPSSRVVDGTSRVAEFMLVGGATLVLLPFGWLLRWLAGLDAAELAVGFLAFHAAYVINDPHFAVTYLLFYKDVRRRALGADVGLAQRARYVIAGFVVPAAMLAWSIAALRLRSAQMLGWMVQLMYLLVGWHYVKQGFGVVTVLSARRGRPLGQRERTVVLFHAFAAWAFAWANPSSPGGVFEEKGVIYTALARPRWVELSAGAALAAATVALVWVLASKWIRERRMVPGAPLAGFLITVWAWSIFSSVDPVLQYLIPGLHSVQYLYFVWLMKRNEARAEEGPPSFGRPVAVRVGALFLASVGLGWLLFHGAPGFLDAALATPRRGAAADALGATPFLAVFFVFVNTHHYFMDHVVWRRENPDTRYLRDPPPAKLDTLAG
jgi:hypothetical protein